MNRLESVLDNDAILEDENLLSAEPSPTHDCQWETIETMVFNGYVPANSREPETIALSDIVVLHLTWSDRFWDIMEELLVKMICHRKPVRSMEIYRNTTIVFNQVDSYSRKLFPLTFFALVGIYYFGYVYIL
jgi:hypothetical protein